MIHRSIGICLRILLAGIVALCLYSLLQPPHALFAAPRPKLTLNLNQGPLGVTISIKGQNFTPGPATAQYTDSQGQQGLFTNAIQVQADGTFGINSATNPVTITMPSNGPTGQWKISVIDSQQQKVTATYTVLAAQGQPAGVPALTASPASAMSGDQISFTGTNWLPGGIDVNILLVVDPAANPIFEETVHSDGNGNISGNFQLPTNLTVSTVTPKAEDVASGDLQAQTTITILQPTPTPSPSPSPTITVTAGSSPTATLTSTPAGASSGSTPGAGNTPGGSNQNVLNINNESLLLILLVTGGTLGIAALMLILFMIPWGERKAKRPW